LAELDLVRRQLIFAAAGFAVIILTAAIDYHTWQSISRTMYLGTIITLGLVFVIGTALFGSARWFDTGVIKIQPSEIAKIVLILVMADFFTRHREQIQTDMRWIIRSFFMMMGITIWILLQPNLSTSIVMVVLWFAMLWMAGVKIKHLLILAAIVILILAIIIPIIVYFDLFPLLLKLKIINQYQLDRITAFIAPAEGASYGDTYNIQQALISIGSGGWFGQGYGYGSQVQLRFLKVRHTDFIFSAMAQEFGFIGTILVILVLLFVIYRCLRAARLARDTYGAFIAYGVGTLIVFQAMVNIGVNLNLGPATGLTLPFVSYGGSSLLSTLLGIGLVESVILRHRDLDF
jgi:rod shape determining protein RodA